MILACLLPVASMAASLVGQSLVVAMAMSSQADAGDGGPPTPKEQALIEHACPTMQRAGAARNAYEQCFSAKLISLRADFGRDLSRLSPAARNKIDTACSTASATLGREAYVRCLSGQLKLLSAGMAHAAPPAPAIAVVPAPDVTAPSAPSLPPAPTESSLVSVQTAAMGLAAVAALGALAFFAVKSKRPRHVCRVCSVPVAGAGDLCAACRHEAAETVRRAAAERAERQRAEEDEQRRKSDYADERVEQQRQEEERLRRVEEGRRLEEEARRRDEDAQRAEDERRQAEELQRAGPAAADQGDDDIFDPYRTLGLPPDASGDQVRAAYEEARLKYDPDQVAHLGNDAQEHFAAKFRTIERAYRLLNGAEAHADRVTG